MGLGRSRSADTKPGMWGWVTKPLTKDLLPLSRTHAPSFLSRPPHLQLEEVAHKTVLPVTSSLIYWLLSRLGHKELVHHVPPHILWWQNSNHRGEDCTSRWRASSAFGIAVTWCPIQPFATSADASYKKKSTTVSVRATDRCQWDMRWLLGSFFLKWSDENYSGVAGGPGANCGGPNPFASRVGHTGFVWTHSSLGCVLLESSKSHLSQGVALFERHLGIDHISFSFSF